MEKRVACYEYIPNEPNASETEPCLGALNLYCQQNGMVNVEHFIDKDGEQVKASRLELARMIAAVENNMISSVIVPSMSRLAKSSKHLLSLLQIFEKKSIRFISLNDKIDTETTKEFSLLSILCSIVQFENDLSSGRTKRGLHQARLEGKLIGRKKTRDSELIRKLLRVGMTCRQIASISKTSHGSVYQELVELRREETAAKEMCPKRASRKGPAAGRAKENRGTS